jgi:hypothetical protein
MPTLSVFIRKEDVDKWKALENKSEFMHNALNVNDGFVQEIESYNWKPKTLTANVGTIIVGNDTPGPEVIIDDEEKFKNSNFTFCKFGHAIPDSTGKCMGKGCKYSR